jgi:hypothetical protein
MSSGEWVKEHSGKIIVGFIVISLTLLIIIPYVTSSGMADLCVRRPMCVNECCPDTSGFKSDGVLSAVRKKLHM